MRRRIPASTYPWCATCRVVRVKGRDNQFCSQACVPREVRAANCRKGRKTYAYRRRAIFLKRHLDALAGKNITREELCSVLWACRVEGYHAGYHVGRRGQAQAFVDAQERGVA